MDDHERSLAQAYNTAVEQFSQLPKGDPRRGRAAATARYWLRALNRYRRSLHN